MPKFSIRLVAMICVMAALCLPALRGNAQAAPYVTDKDLQVAVRTFSFVYGMPKGDVDIEIVYDPGNEISANDARELKGIIGAGNVFSNRTVKATLVPVGQMGETHSRLAYITHGLQGQYDSLLARAKENKMLTFSTDFQCVDSQKCVMGVEADPAIKIEISRAATAASELEFSQALKLMIREVE